MVGIMISSISIAATRWPMHSLSVVVAMVVVAMVADMVVMASSAQLRLSLQALRVADRPLSPMLNLKLRPMSSHSLFNRTINLKPSLLHMVEAKAISAWALAWAIKAKLPYKKATEPCQAADLKELLHFVLRTSSLGVFATGLLPILFSSFRPFHFLFQF
jgi:hypothetical protein